MSSPYERDPVIPGPYARTKTVSYDKKTRKQSDRGDESGQQSSQAGAAIAFVPGQEAAVVSSSSQLAWGSNAVNAVGGSVSSSVAATSAAATQTSALAAAHAMVQSMLSAMLAANAAMAPVASAISSAVAAVGPFVVLAVAGSYGLTNPDQVAKAVEGLTEAMAEALSEAIEATVADYAGQSEIELIANARAVVDHISGLVGDFDFAALSPAHPNVAANRVAPASGGEGATYFDPYVVSISRLTAPENQEHAVAVTFNTFDGLVTTTYTIPAQNFETTRLVPLHLQHADRQGGIVERDVTVAITNVNEVPVITGISIVEVPENAANAVAVVTSVDEEDGAVETKFLLPIQDFEASPTFLLNGEIVDAGGLSSSFGFPISVVNVNEAPDAPTVTSSFEGGVLVITATATDPDGEVLPSQTWSYTLQELAADPAPFVATFTDIGGLTSSVVIDPPGLGAQAAADNPQPPVILGYSIATLPENQGGVLTVTAYDAIDGVITREIAIASQNYEALALKSISVPIEITNSAGLTTTATHEIAVTNVNEISLVGYRTGNLNSYVENGEMFLDAGQGRAGEPIFDFGFISTDGQPLVHGVVVGNMVLSYNPTPSVPGHNYTVFATQDLGSRQLVRIEARGEDGDYASHDFYLNIGD